MSIYSRYAQAVTPVAHPRFRSERGALASRLCTVLTLLCLFTVALQTASRADTFDLFYTFTGGNDGGQPSSRLMQARDGNFYGTTGFGGANNTGTIYKISPAGALTTLFTFSARSKQGSNPDGANPFWGLIQARDGNLYGCTESGGANNTGTLFRITTSGTLTTLHTFAAFDAQFDNADGAYPFAALTQAKDGNLYGSCEQGGLNGAGALFKITLQGRFAAIYQFAAVDGSEANAEGAYPEGALIQATDGNLYGTCYAGGTNGNGAIFMLRLLPSISYVLLHAFSAGPVTNADGAYPWAGLIQATDGNFYGTTFQCGAHGYGTVFQITPGGGLTTLHSFDGTDGAAPTSGLVQAADGNLYGTTRYGPVPGSIYGTGALYALTLSGIFTSLHTFGPLEGNPPNSNADGAYPRGELIQAADGGLYGTTLQGGADGQGTLFRLAIPPHLVSLSPDHLPAGTAESRLTLTGTGFEAGATLNWNVTSLPTTFVSPTRLTALIPAADLKQPGTVAVSVTNPQGGGTSNALTFTIVPAPMLAVTVGTLSRSSSNVITIPLTVSNQGTGAADAVELTRSLLGTASTSSALPLLIGDLSPGATATISLIYPGSAGAAGVRTTLTLKGTYLLPGTGTPRSYSLSIKVTLP